MEEEKTVGCRSRNNLDKSILIEDEPSLESLTVRLEEKQKEVIVSLSDSLGISQASVCRRLLKIGLDSISRRVVRND